MQGSGECSIYLVLHTSLVLPNSFDCPTRECIRQSAEGFEACAGTYMIFSSSVKNFAVMGESGNQSQYDSATIKVIPPVRRKKTRQGLKALSSPICNTA